MDSQFLAVLFVFAATAVCWKSLPVFSAWLRARRSAAPIPLLTLWSIYFRNVPLESIVNAHISVQKAGARVPLGEMVAHAKAGGDIRAVVHAYVETLRAGTSIEFAHVCEIELNEAAEEDS